jgi:dihydrofolate reductase
MAKVRADISMSLDGFIAGANDSPELPMGEGGERLHEWIFELASWRKRHGLSGGRADQDSELLEEAFAGVGAVVLGKRMFENAKGWGDEPPFHVPVFVLTHEVREPLAKEGGTTFTFVTDGVESALAQARAAAGDGDVSVGGGANTIQQFIRARLLDEIQVHVVPVLLGGGIRLFDNLGRDIELERTRIVESPDVVHLRFRIGRAA